MTLYRATMSGLYVGQLIQNVVYFQSRTNPGVPGVACQVVAEDLAANWVPNYLTLQQSGMRWNSVQVIEIRNPAPMPGHVTPINLVGGGVTESHSVSCFKIKWITDRGGRRGFGKMYIGGINWALIQGGNVLNQTARDRLLAFCANIEARYQVGDIGAPVPFFQVLVHKDPNDPPNSINTCTFYPELGVQRRRSKGVGV